MLGVPPGQLDLVVGGRPDRANLNGCVRVVPEFGQRREGIRSGLVLVGRLYEDVFRQREEVGWFDRLDRAWADGELPQIFRRCG